MATDAAAHVEYLRAQVKEQAKVGNYPAALSWARQAEAFAAEAGLQGFVWLAQKDVRDMLEQNHDLPGAIDVGRELVSTYRGFMQRRAAEGDTENEYHTMIQLQDALTRLSALLTKRAVIDVAPDGLEREAWQAQEEAWSYWAVPMMLGTVMRGGLTPGFLSERASVLSNLALRRAAVGQTEEALEAAHDAITLYEELRPERDVDGDVAHILKNIGAIYGRSGDHENGCTYLLRAVEIYEQMPRPLPRPQAQAFVSALASLAHCHRKLGRDDNAELTQREAERIAVEENVTHMLAPGPHAWG